MIQSLGADSVALGFAGGKSGELLKDGLHSLGISTDFVWANGETRTNVSIVSDGNNQYIKVNEPGPTITEAEQLALLEKIQALSQSGDWWVLAGSLPPGLPANFYARLVTIIQSTGARVILDTSGEALIYGCQARPFLVKPNEFELQELTGLPTEKPKQIIQAAITLQEIGVSNVVASLGIKGAIAVTQEGSWRVLSPAIKERNPIGAGDSMVGGLVWGLSRGMLLDEALRWGVACGAAAASLGGTDVGSFDLVKRLSTQATVMNIM
jgi:1-phosphofructokinase family hexose kinase